MTLAPACNGHHGRFEMLSAGRADVDDIRLFPAKHLRFVGVDGDADQRTARQCGGGPLGLLVANGDQFSAGQMTVAQQIDVPFTDCPRADDDRTQLLAHDLSNLDPGAGAHRILNRYQAPL